MASSRVVSCMSTCPQKGRAWPPAAGAACRASRGRRQQPRPTWRCCALRGCKQPVTAPPPTALARGASSVPPCRVGPAATATRTASPGARWWWAARWTRPQRWSVGWLRGRASRATCGARCWRSWVRGGGLLRLLCHAAPPRLHTAPPHVARRATWLLKGKTLEATGRGWSTPVLAGWGSTVQRREPAHLHPPAHLCTLIVHEKRARASKRPPPAANSPVRFHLLCRREHQQAAVQGGLGHEQAQPADRHPAPLSVPGHAGGARDVLGMPDVLGACWVCWVCSGRVCGWGGVGSCSEPASLVA